MAVKKDESISIHEINTGTVEMCIVGTTPMIQQSMSAKVRNELLLPAVKKNAAEKESSPKHFPMEEFRASMYRMRGDKTPTVIGMPAGAVKAAIRSAALDMPGATKSKIGRLTYVDGGDMVPIYGVPQLLMSVVRCADANRTPDIRTRAILPKWAAKIAVTFVKPMLREQAVVNLVAAAGVIIGLSDWRPEKGSGNYGQFRICGIDDPEYKEILKTGGRIAQQKAIDDPALYDEETEAQMSYYNAESRRRGMKVA